MLRVVRTENGLVRGIEAADPRITAFKGIPFAAPPIGRNRWRAPQPCEDWEGELQAYRFAPVSVQDTPGIGDNLYNREWHVDPEVPMSEDCLYLNVWTGAKSADEKRPVVVWYFGGGLQWGYTSEMEFDGERVARRGIVVVTVNYRLNVFGFLAHPELTKNQPDAPTNFGSLDQQAGLKWVIRNIEAFGGDPGNITIAGQSAGGGSVLSQMTAPGNKGLFQKAIIQSALILDPYTRKGIINACSMEDAEKLGSEFIEYLGVSTIEEARKLDAMYIRDKYAEFARGDFGRMFKTAQDGIFCVGRPLDLIVKGECVRGPIMAGNTTDEFHCIMEAEDDDEVIQKAGALFGDKADEFIRIIKERQQDIKAAGLNGGNDGMRGATEVSGIECTAKALFSECAKLDRDDCYYYRFDADIPGDDNPGKFHSVELWFFFETLAKCSRPFVGKHYDLARQMCNYWCNFIKTGNPNGTDADGTQMTEWPAYSEDNPKEMVFGTDGPYISGRRDSSLENYLRDRIAELIK